MWVSEGNYGNRSATNSQQVYKRKNNQKQVKQAALICTFLWKLPARTVSEVCVHCDPGKMQELSSCKDISEEWRCSWCRDCFCTPRGCTVAAAATPEVLWVLRVLGLPGVWSVCSCWWNPQKNLQKIRHFKKYLMVQNHWHVAEKESYCTALNSQAGEFVSMDLSLFHTRIYDLCPVSSTAANCTNFVANRKKNTGKILCLSLHIQKCA